MPSPTVSLAATHLALASGGLPADAVSAEGPVHLLRPGTFHGAELADVEAGPWMGLYRTATGYHLAPTELALEPFRDAGAGDGPHERTGISVSATSTREQPLFLVQGGTSWEAGPVQTALGEGGLLQPGERLGLDRGAGDADLVVAYGSVQADVIDPSTPIYEDYRLQLVAVDDGRPVRTQELAWSEAFDLSRVPSLWFAGDLDRDGRLDLVLDLAPEEGEELVLFLSSAAAPGELVAEVAWRRNTGC